MTFLVFYLLARVVDRVLTRVLAQFSVDETTRSFAAAVMRFVLVAIGVVAALSELGINTTALLASMGVAGLTIGFAARDALSNLVSGFFIFWDRPFVLGDLVDFEDIHGRVDKITLRATRIVTPDGKMISVPNSLVLNGAVTSYTNTPHLRLEIPVGVGVEEDLGRVRRLLLEIPASDPDFLHDPAPSVVVTSLGDYFIQVELRAWIDNERLHLRKRPELRERVLDVLRRAGVHLPYETFSIDPVEIRSGQVGPAN